ncbi:MAG: carbon-phosphorus lyase complex subunit PhnI [Clostridiales Family XIII bacterium]|nr:carbon-phosphorus lyase complex subunit PhnI [Clostridiales Family XIII bacterium]
MAYAAVSGGENAIKASIELTRFFRKDEPWFDPSLMDGALNLLLDKVMSESGFYSEKTAAIALKQCEGSTEEAVFLLRAYRSTLSRKYYSKPLDTKHMRVIRRISAVFKDIPGGQRLGPTYDYTHRLIQPETRPAAILKLEDWIGDECSLTENEYPKVVDLLRDQNLLEYNPDPMPEYYDITKRPLVFPCSRSARLQALSRGESGFIIGVAYSFLRGHTVFHPNVGELRCGFAGILIEYAVDKNDVWYVGEILLTEVDCVLPRTVVAKTAVGEQSLRIATGYGVAFGRNETKAIAMSILDCTMDMPGDDPCNNSEFILLSGDTVEMNGFVSHLKLPHYVTFQSKLDRVRESVKAWNSDES